MSSPFPSASPPNSASPYHRKLHRGMVYTHHRESLFIKIIADDGTVGWGETPASVAPQIAAQVVESLIKPQLVGKDPLAGDVLGQLSDTYTLQPHIPNNSARRSHSE